MESQHSLADEKRRRIARAAVDVFGEKGFDRAKMNDIARAAEVGKGTLYEYFENKEALAEGAFEILSRFGLPPMAGRAWGAFLVTGAPHLSLTSVAKHLKVSAGSMSAAISLQEAELSQLLSQRFPE